MLLDLSKIIDMPGASIDFSVSLDLSDLEFGSCAPLKSPVTCEGTVRNTAGVLMTTGTICAHLDAVCDRCGGSGYVGSQMCECLAELCRQEQKKELTFLSAGRESFDQFRLDYYSDKPDPRLGFSPRSVMEKTYADCRRYAFGFHPKSGNLLFSGNTGLGKTFLSACIARAVADQGYSVVYESAGHLFAALEKARFEANDENRRAAAKYTECDLLIVDDLGTELPGQFVTAALYSLINDRLLESRPTIISTNLSEEELVRRYNPQIASRLRGSYRRVAFVGDDIRLLKNRGVLR